MAEYTKKDIIIFADDPRVQEAIGKECYFSDVADFLLEYANDDEFCNRLLTIKKNTKRPFVSKFGTQWTFMIVKKEDPKPEYTSFESLEEFIDTYETQSKNLPKLETTINSHGMWLKKIRSLYSDFEDPFPLISITGLYKDGINLENKGYTTSWEELFRCYQFLNGTPCGKLKE